MKCEIIIFVENLDQCRSFYRDQLGLGAPETESNHLMSFLLKDELRLSVEEHHAPYLEHASGACRFLLTVDDYADRIEELVKNGVNVSDEFVRGGRLCRRVCDPEGNVILIAAESV